MVVLAGAIALAGGRGALRLLGVDGEMSSRVEELGWSWLVGLSVTAISGLLLFLSGRPVTGWLALLPSLLLALSGAVAVLARRIPGDRVTDRPSWGRGPSRCSRIRTTSIFIRVTLCWSPRPRRCGVVWGWVLRSLVSVVSANRLR